LLEGLVKSAVQSAVLGPAEELPPVTMADVRAVQDVTTACGLVKRLKQWGVGQARKPHDPAPDENPPAVDLEAQAIALPFKHPDWSIAQIADALKVARKTLYKWPRFRAAAESCGRMKPRGPKGRTPPRGHKTRDGRVEAYAREDEGD